MTAIMQKKVGGVPAWVLAGGAIWTVALVTSLWGAIWILEATWIVVENGSQPGWRWGAILGWSVGAATLVAGWYFTDIWARRFHQPEEESESR